VRIYLVPESAKEISGKKSPEKPPRSIDQAHRDTHGANTKTEKSQKHFFVPWHISGDNGTAYTIAFIFFDSPDIDRIFHDFQPKK